MSIGAALDPDDGRRLTASVAGPAALLVAKLHRLAERRAGPDRLMDKDAHDIYRLLVAVSTQTLVAAVSTLLDDPLAGPATDQALTYLDELFGSGPDALGSVMAGRAEELIGQPATVSAAVAALAQDLRSAVRP
jgi:hypothetical protein